MLNPRGVQVRQMPQFQGLDPRLLVSSGEGISQGIERGLDRYEQGVDRRRRREQEDLQTQMLEMQLGEQQRLSEMARERDEGLRADMMAAVDIAKTARGSGPSLDDMLESGTITPYQAQLARMSDVLGDRLSPDMVAGVADTFAQRMMTPEEVPDSLEAVELPDGGVIYRYGDTTIRPQDIVRPASEEGKVIKHIGGNVYATPSGSELVKIGEDEYVSIHRVGPNDIRRTGGEDLTKPKELAPAEKTRLYNTYRFALKDIRDAAPNTTAHEKAMENYRIMVEKLDDDQREVLRRSGVFVPTPEELASGDELDLASVDNDEAIIMAELRDAIAPDGLMKRVGSRIFAMPLRELWGGPDEQVLKDNSIDKVVEAEERLAEIGRQGAFDEVLDELVKRKGEALNRNTKQGRDAASRIDEIISRVEENRRARGDATDDEYELPEEVESWFDQFRQTL